MDDTMVEMRWNVDVENDPVKRIDSLHRTAQSTTKDETEASNSSMQGSDTTGSAITSERPTTTNQSSDLGKG